MIPVAAGTGGTGPHVGRTGELGPAGAPAAPCGRRTGARWGVTPLTPPGLRAPAALVLASRAPAGTPPEAVVALVLALAVPVVGPVLGVVLGRSARRRCEAEGLPGRELALSAEVVGWVLLGVLALGVLVVGALVVLPLAWLAASGP